MRPTRLNTSWKLHEGANDKTVRPPMLEGFSKLAQLLQQATVKFTDLTDAISCASFPCHSSGYWGPHFARWLAVCRRRFGKVEDVDLRGSWHVLSNMSKTGLITWRNLEEKEMVKTLARMDAYMVEAGYSGPKHDLLSGSLIVCTYPQDILRFR